MLQDASLSIPCTGLLSSVSMSLHDFDASVSCELTSGEDDVEEEEEDEESGVIVFAL